VSNILTTGRNNFIADLIALLPECHSNFYDVRTAGETVDWVMFSNVLNDTTGSMPTYPFVAFSFGKASSNAFGVTLAGFEQEVSIFYVVSLKHVDGTSKFLSEAQAEISEALIKTVFKSMRKTSGRGYLITSDDYVYNDSKDIEANEQAAESRAKFAVGSLRMTMLICGAP